jgi:4-hydroxybenzoate polyprenyltransferase
MKNIDDNQISSSFRKWMKAIRIQHWIKNVLVFVPSIANHSIFDIKVLINSTICFFLFSLCASSVYLINDLYDIEADLKHPIKRRRPIAAGEISKKSAITVALTMIVSIFFVTLMLSVKLLYMLCIYLFVAIVYSKYLKKLLIIDVITLALLYCFRIIAGGIATQIQISVWLISFAAFFFLSLAFLKRHNELLTFRLGTSTDNLGRSYLHDDIQFLEQLGVNMGVASTIVFALYITDSGTSASYSNPQILFLLLPIMIYWLSMNWLLAHRKTQSDDLVVNLLNDKVLLLLVPLTIAIVFIAI